jgi:GntR family histidine utilization transcriptional repressor
VVKPEKTIGDRIGTSLQDRIRDEIEGNVMMGRWSPGHRIPYEHELMKQYGCSRMTVNRALGSLVERGLIERRKRAGSFVTAPKFHKAAFELPELRSHVLAQGKTYDYDLLTHEVRQANASDRSHLNIAGGEVCHLRCLHYVDAKPYAYENRIINLDLVPEALDADFASEPPSSWLFAHVPWSDARHVISAVNADAELARQLDIREDCACMLVERWTWRKPERTTYVRMIHPGQSFSIEAFFRP